jgi:hypothetical protein
MKRWLAVALFLLGTSIGVRAQDGSTSLIAGDNAAADFSQTSAASQPVRASVGVRADRIPPFSVSSEQTFSDPFVIRSLDSRVLMATPAFDTVAPRNSAEPATPAARNSKYDYGRDRWELGVGVTLVRFRSSVYYATAVGLNTSVAYFLKDWLAIEGAVTSAFAPAVFRSYERVKYVGYGAGPKISFGRDKLEPWVHVLAGGMHILPQTGLSGKNGFEVMAGGGADYSPIPQFAVRLEADWLNTHVFGQTQNSGQAVLGIVFHF